MEQHPVPQQISSYQFRLVGDMTLKQFFQVAGGVLVSLLFYASNLNPAIKWPFIIFFTLFGAALAFLPFEERPLEAWILAFFRAIYSPTSYSWSKTSKRLVFFQPETSGLAKHPQTKENKLIPNYEVKRNPFLKKLEDTEKGFLNNMANLFSVSPSTPTSTSTPVSPNLPTAISNSTLPINPQTNQTTKPQVAVPQTHTPTVQTPQLHNIPNPPSTPEIKPSIASPIFVRQKPQIQKGAHFTPTASPPNPPTIPNTVTGQVLNTEGHIVEGAILEIIDTDGKPVRAFKSNKLGHFITVTPLSKGLYQLSTEKEGLEFSPVTFEANGAIIPPIEIKATKQIKTKENEN